ncbi:hypothetical protein BANRA_05035 [Klebsiella pneumoniae]|nr:hypothetical protein BANRA_05035 [Klebsiella pneumoniae]
MSSSLKYLLLVAPAALMIAILFLYPLGFSLVSAFTAPGQPFTLDHFRKVYALYASDVLFSLLIVLISVALLALLAITLSAVIALSPCRPVVRLLGFLYRLPLFIPFIVVAQMMRTFLAKNGLMNNALVAADLVTPLETLSAGMERDSDHLCLEATGLCHAADLRGDGGAGVVADPCCT